MARLRLLDGGNFEIVNSEVFDNKPPRTFEDVGYQISIFDSKRRLTTLSGHAENYAMFITVCCRLAEWNEELMSLNS